MSRLPCGVRKLKLEEHFHVYNNTYFSLGMPSWFNKTPSNNQILFLLPEIIISISYSSNTRHSYFRVQAPANQMAQLLEEQKPALGPGETLLELGRASVVDSVMGSVLEPGQKPEIPLGLEQRVAR